MYRIATSLNQALLKQFFSPSLQKNIKAMPLICECRLGMTIMMIDFWFHQVYLKLKSF